MVKPTWVDNPEFGEAQFKPQEGSNTIKFESDGEELEHPKHGKYVKFVVNGGLTWNVSSKALIGTAMKIFKDNDSLIGHVMSFTKTGEGLKTRYENIRQGVPTDSE